MARAIVLSNGELGVTLDSYGEVRDLFYPHIGLEDHVRGHYTHRLGVWIDGHISWFSEDSGWKISVSCESDALVSSITALHDRLQVELHFSDAVYNERPVFIRKVTVKNLSEKQREIKLYFGHQFEIYKAPGGDTSYFDPLSYSIVHYKGRRVFLIKAVLDGEDFNDYATGRANFEGKEGSHRDAEDGLLSKNPIEHGPADSVIGLYGVYAPSQSRTCYYWIVAAKSIAEAHDLNAYVVKKTPQHLLDGTRTFWYESIRAHHWSFHGLAEEHITLFKQSLSYVHAHADSDGGLLASLDSAMLQYGLDTYTYVWPRDGAFMALTLDLAGNSNVSKRFFEFCNSVISKDGYFMHKYLPDGSLGSSWHPWVQNGKVQLPIQEDETALVVYAFYQHYVVSHDLELLEDVYDSLVEKAADFMSSYRDPKTKLPLPSYDLWEEKHGCSTFTSSAVFAALTAAAELSRILGKTENESRYRSAAQEIQVAILTHLWDSATSSFVKLVKTVAGERVVDSTVDISSVYSVFAFGVLPANDPRLLRAFESTVRTLSYGISTGGLARYNGDYYFRVSDQSAGNPWVITTLWYAEFLIAHATSESDFARIRELFSWVVRYAQPSGVLAEQMHPHTGEQLSASPLAWSHSGYVTAVIKYMKRLEELGIAPACN